MIFFDQRLKAYGEIEAKDWKRHWQHGAAYRTVQRDGWWVELVEKGTVIASHGGFATEAEAERFARNLQVGSSKD